MAEWRDILGFGNRYQVSDDGQVRGSRGQLRVSYSQRGYQRVCLKAGEKTVSRMVSVLVLEAFVGHRPAKHFAAHGDGDVDNNRLTNLRWATQEQNEADKIIHGRKAAGERHGASKLDEGKVRTIRERVAQGAGKRALAREYGVSARAICDAAAGRWWSHVR